MPLNDIHLELHRLERQRPPQPWSDSLAAPHRARRTVGGLRYRLGQALIAGGMALSGPASGHARTKTTRPVSAHR